MSPNSLVRTTDNSRYCVIGAGPAGLTATKNLKLAGFEVDCIEQQDDVGGNWYFGSPHSSVHATTSLISSKRLTEFCDFRMPRHYPHYPSHSQALDYLRSYAEHFGLYKNIDFQRTVKSVTRADQTSAAGQGGRWIVCSERPGGAPVETAYDGVIVANGHHWDPQLPNLPGPFLGEAIHSRELARSIDLASRLRGRHVLIVGAGNSGCDLAVEAAAHARSATISMRRGYHVLPKYLFGAPLDRCGANMHRWKIKGRLFEWITRLCLYVAVGPMERSGMPKPDHRLFQSHPIVNSRILDCVRQGQLQVKPDVDRLAGDRVVFNDGSEVECDLIIYATGFKLSFPFLSPTVAPLSNLADLALNMFDPVDDGLWFVGLIQPTGGIWQLADYQSQLLAHFIQSERQGSNAAEWFRDLLKSQSTRRERRNYVPSTRHALEVDYFEYRDEMKRRIRQFQSRGVELKLAAPAVRPLDRALKDAQRDVARQKCHPATMP